ncbi:MAG: hypothetical protein NTW25_07980 [Candidatus Kapabacteria bacterium]|nr:hypothetical protein [Candidatus Kapabacteria bacterium]
MIKFLEKIEENSDNFITILSILSILIGIAFSILLIFKYVSYGVKFEENYVKLIAVLIASGLLGSTLKFALEKLVTKQVKKHCENEIKLKVENEVEKKVIKEVEKRVKEEVEKKVKEEIGTQLPLAMEEVSESTKIEIENKNNYNTVIVPVAKSIEFVKENSQYRCPKNRSFKEGLKYIAFYKDKKVIGYGKLSESFPKVVENDWVFKFEEFIDKIIIHNEKGAYVQNKRYCTIESLSNKETKNTSQLI